MRRLWRPAQRSPEALIVISMTGADATADPDKQRVERAEGERLVTLIRRLELAATPNMEPGGPP
jgi:hypothetical protein